MDNASSRSTQTTSSANTDITPEREIPAMCRHQPPCPTADSADRDAAQILVHHPEQGWSLLCNGVLLFEDTGELLPNGQVIAPHRTLGSSRVATAA